MFQTMFFFSVQVCLNPWTVLRQPDLRRYYNFFGQERYVFMFLCEKNCACGHGLRCYQPSACAERVNRILSGLAKRTILSAYTKTNIGTLSAGGAESMMLSACTQSTDSSQHSQHSPKNLKWWIRWSQGGTLRCPQRKIWEERTVLPMS